MTNIQLIRRHLTRQNVIKLWFLLATASLLEACGSTTSKKQNADLLETTNADKVTDDPNISDYKTSNTDKQLSPVVDFNIPNTLEPDLPALDNATSTYEILSLNHDIYFTKNPIDYAPQDQIEMPLSDQAYAESYLSIDKNITRFATWSGNEAIDALLNASPVFSGRTGQVWTGIGESNIISFSFVDPVLLLLDESAYGHNYADGAQPINAVNNGVIVAFTEFQKDAIRQAFAEYEKYIDLAFVEVTETQNEVGTIRIGLSLSEFENVAAFALLPSSYWASAGDIWFFHEAIGEDFTPGDSWYYYAILHELGHALGLKHSHEAITDNETILDKTLDAINYTLMSYNEPDWGWYSHEEDEIWTVSHGPQVLDIQALQYLYGPNLDYNLGNTLYEFSALEPISLTIWDGGGIDLLDLSQIVVSAKISLEPGTFSTIPIKGWSPSENIGIAYGTVIENVIGSMADDIIVGNAYDNILSGHEGDDVLYGGAGNDIFDWHENSRTGSDLFVGGTGDDTYYLSVGDAVIEETNGGTDSIILIDIEEFVTPKHIERVFVAHGAGATIIGNELNNILMGGAGDDILTGGDGADIFLISSNMGHDIITDFDESEGDQIMFAASSLEVVYTETDFGFTLDFGSNGYMMINSENLIA